ncbi:hypothetical protein [Vibrio caribbeanicus]|uniref:Uncharacterized protein n=1 Tax=Vibrio caribbeanicus ATCC BAA-2122 TaxID=796620 RepID=E3BI08_9VIBR|nr:hypothetical protein [Vibrio caribbeanicus]EFP97447.1 hypothetical protein VIBC2010_18689 [Vibrio caribbeanicus ATCC BAA-2122]
MLFLKNNASFYLVKIAGIELLLLVRDDLKEDLKDALVDSTPVTEEKAREMISKGAIVQCHQGSLCPIFEGCNVDC